ncbi:MAG: DciA family protein [Blastocatellia bacterium]
MATIAFPYEMNSLLKMLPAMIRLSGDNEEVREQAVFAAWRLAAGDKIARICLPFQLQQKHLVITVLDATWKKQMQAVSGEYLFRINSMLGRPYVTFIEFRVNRKFVLANQPMDAQPIEFTHTQELEEELKSSAACIKDDALREQFLRAAAKCLERRGE